MIKYKFKIGDWVEVKSIVKFDYNENMQREIIKKEKKFIGQVCGLRKRHLGELKNYPTHSYCGDYDPPYLKVEEVVEVYLVTIGMINLPYEVLEEDIRLLDNSMYEYYARRLPKKYCYISDKTRKILSEYSKDFLRDSKGRFI